MSVATKGFFPTGKEPFSCGDMTVATTMGDTVARTLG